MAGRHWDPSNQETSRRATNQTKGHRNRKQTKEADQGEGKVTLTNKGRGRGRQKKSTPTKKEGEIREKRDKKKGDR